MLLASKTSDDTKAKLELKVNLKTNKKLSNDFVGLEVQKEARYNICLLTDGYYLHGEDAQSKELHKQYEADRTTQACKGGWASHIKAFYDVAAGRIPRVLGS